MSSSSSAESNRREFLSGQAAVRALQHAVPGEPSGDAQRSGSAASPATYLMEVGRSAMACDFAVYLNASQRALETESAVAALDLVDQLESQLTVYRPHSEVMEINRRAAASAVPVEARLFGLLEEAVALHQTTQGAFDITSGPLSQAWGFFRRAGQFPSPEAIEAALARVGTRWLQLEPADRSVRFLRPDIEINLNAIGKGYALDRCAELLIGQGVQDFLLHGGKSSVLAHGTRTRGSETRGWTVAIKHPFRPQDPLIEIDLQDGALGTSGAGNQFFHFQGRRYGHILDPRTGWPANRVLSATVLAPRAATADALATALFVLGLESASAVCASQAGVGALLVASGRRQGEVEVHSFGLEPSQWRHVAG